MILLIITRENLNKKKVNVKVYKNINRWSSDMKEIWNVKIVIYYKYTNYKWKKTGMKNHIFGSEIG